MGRKSYKYRIFPTKAQTTRLEQTLGVCCELYNAALQERRDAYRLERKSIRYLDQQNQLPDIKAIRDDVAGIHSQVLQDVLRRLDGAFQNFFRRVKERREKIGFPRFRSRFRYDSFTYAGTGFSLQGKLRLSKIGEVRIKLHRPIKGKIKTLTITRSATGKWFACFSVVIEPEVLACNADAVGIDVGLTHFATLSTGEQIANPRFFRTDEKALARAQRKKNRKAARRIHERIANRRRNFAHQISRSLVNRFGLIVFENLNIAGMVKNPRLAKSIADAAWNQLIQFTDYKAENAGGLCGQINSRNTSRLTACCGELVEIALSDRVIHCPKCHSTTDRDWNASINILLRGLAQVGLRAREASLPLGRGVITQIG